MTGEESNNAVRIIVPRKCPQGESKIPRRKNSKKYGGKNSGDCQQTAVSARA